MAVKYRLKKGQPAFDVVDGPMAGQRFEPGVPYDEIPKGDAARFEKVKPKAAQKPADSDKGGK